MHPRSDRSTEVPDPSLGERGARPERARKYRPDLPAGFPLVIFVLAEVACIAILVWFLTLVP